MHKSSGRHRSFCFQTSTTKDIFRAHSTLPNTWSHVGRNDDIIVFLNGEKTNPVSFEATISRHPDIKSALVFGNQRSEAGILIEPTPEKQSKLPMEGSSGYVSNTYSSIEEANSATPAHARIARTHVIFTSPDKPFLRASKGTIQRQVTIELYKDAISNLYDLHDQVPLNEFQRHKTNLANGNSEKMTASLDITIDNCIKRATTLDVPSVTADFFSSGLDSLQALRLLRALRNALNVSTTNTSLIYFNPSVASLAVALEQLSSRTCAPATTTATAPRLFPPNHVDEMFEKHASYLSVLANCSPVNHSFHGPTQYPPNGHILLLTGSSGFVGSVLLSTLASDPTISQIYALDRRYVSAHSSKKVIGLVGNISSPVYLGLSQNMYSSLLSSVTLIIHIAWPVDFVQPLSQFEKPLAGTSHLLLFSAQSKTSPAFVFLSSVAAVMNHAAPDLPVPEAVVYDSNVASGGYGEGKLIAERLVELASKYYGVRGAVARLGQVAGSKGGKDGKEGTGWNEKEWFPRLIRSNKALGVVPSALEEMAGKLEWIGIDEVGRIISEIGIGMGQDARESVRVYNIVNSYSSSWTEVIDVVKTILGVEAVDGKQWIGKLREHSLTTRSEDKLMEDIPASPLEEFYANLFEMKHSLIFETANARRASVTMRMLEPVDTITTEIWIRRIIQTN